MSQRSQQSIEEYLRQSDTQERIWKKIQEARENVTVTISRAAGLFDFSESKLREWEKRGLLQTERSSLSSDGKGSTGHRQYSSTELEKLAIIRVLIDRGYSPGEIPLDVDKLWSKIAGTRPRASTLESLASALPEEGKQERALPIDGRVERMDRMEFWRYFVSQALRISLGLICEDIPDTLAGLLLPLEDRRLAGVIHSPQDLQDVGLSLVGWLGRNRSFYTFLEQTPTFEFPSDFRLEKLISSTEQLPSGDRVSDNVFIIVQRRARPLSLKPELVRTVRRILNLVYQRLDSWRAAFDYGMHDWLYQVHDLERASRETGDIIFNSLLERIIEIGGKDSNGEDRWNFCALLLPNDPSLPIQQQNLNVRAQTRRSPYEIGRATVNPAQTDSLSLKAFQSGQVIYFAETLPGETMLTYELPVSISRGDPRVFFSADNNAQTALEKETRSAIAVPLVGEYGISIAVLYIAANKAQAFSLDDQRVLRAMAKMAEELLLISQTRRQVMGGTGNFISSPSVVDTTFRAFGSETDFIDEIEGFLESIQQGKIPQETSEGGLSVISIDIDNQSRIGAKYGNRVPRNLSQQMGQRIIGQMRLSSRYASGKLFHLSADRYCFVLRGMPLEEAQQLARQLKTVLDGAYLINPSSLPAGRPALTENMLEISGVTTHLGVSGYSLEKLRELCTRYQPDESVKRVRALIVAGIEEHLERGKAWGGNCIVTWNYEEWNYRMLD